MFINSGRDQYFFSKIEAKADLKEKKIFNYSYLEKKFKYENYCTFMS